MKRLKTTLSNPSARLNAARCKQFKQITSSDERSTKKTACVEANSRSQAKNQKAAKALLKRCRDWVGVRISSGAPPSGSNRLLGALV